MVAPTNEQQRAIDFLLKPDTSVMKLVACAGGGKTSTLKLCANAAQVPSLYFAFNAVTAKEAKASFPRHVDCRTGHSLAYAEFGADLQDKLTRPSGKYVNVAGTAAEIGRFYKLEPYVTNEEKMASPTFLGLLVKMTVANYEQSADEKLELKHVPYQIIVDKGFKDESVKGIQNYVLKFAKELWADRISNKTKVLATHDTYLKLYQLSKPVLGGIHILYVDEAQDTTPCVMDIIKNQIGKMKIVLVGDPRQAIYGWRGAVNAMEAFDAPEFPLSKSFRYGPRVAKLATTVLENAMNITGLETIDSKVGYMDVVDRTKPHTRIYRTRAEMIMDAVEEIGKGTEVALDVDVRDFVRMLQSAQALFMSDAKNVKHEEIIPYEVWGDLVKESENDPALKRVARVVIEGLAPEWIKLLETFQSSRNPLITYTTAHGSKGREWSQVILADDFRSCYNSKGQFIGLSTEEQNLLYVALTRAINALEYNTPVDQYLSYAHSTKRLDIEKLVGRMEDYID